MFKVPEGYQVKQLVELAERNYVIQKYDYLLASDHSYVMSH